MTKEIILKLLNADLDDHEQEIVTSILEDKCDLESLCFINIDEPMKQIKSMFNKQIHLLNDELIKPAYSMLNADGAENFIVALQEYIYTEEKLQIEYDDRQVFIKLAKNNNPKFIKWLQDEDLINSFSYTVKRGI